MGCDGGTIPRRDELVRVKKKPEQKDRESELSFRWKHCAIRQLALQAPIVGCGLGRLYSKESVIEGLLDRSMLPETAAHIKSIKDVRDLNLTDNPVYESGRAEKGDCYVHGRSPYICPVIGLEMNGKYKFCFLWTCGCVMSERALREVKTSVCHKCQKPFKDSDVVVMNAEGEDLDRMTANAIERKAQRKSSKKRSHETEKTSEDTSTGPAKEKKKIKKEDNERPSASTSKNSAEDPAYKKSKDSYSVSKDPKATEVFKSLFTSHKSASEQTKAHWITYNPFYN